MIFRETCFLKYWANSKYNDFVKHIEYLYRDSRPYLGWLLSFTYSSLLFWLFLNKTKKSGNCQNVGKICPKFSSLSVLQYSIINNITRNLIFAPNWILLIRSCPFQICFLTVGDNYQKQEIITKFHWVPRPPLNNRRNQNYKNRSSSANTMQKWDLHCIY